MNKLDQFAAVCKNKDEMFVACLVKAGPFTIGPTKRGGFFLQCNSKEVKNDMSLKDLGELRDAIDHFLTEIAGENL